MSIVLVGLPIYHYVRRFHFDKGRQWNVVEHLVLQALSQNPQTAGQIAEAGAIPRRVVLEVMIRLMRAGWVQLMAGSKDVVFHATERGRTVAIQDELPANIERQVRHVSFAIDLLTGSVFRRRDLTLLRWEDWQRRTVAIGAVCINKPEQLPPDLDHVAALAPLFNEDETLIRVDQNDRAPNERLALFSVRDGVLEYAPPNLSATLRTVLVDASKNLALKDKSAPPQTYITVRAQPTKLARPDRETSIRQEDVIKGGDAHEAHIKSVLRRARRYVLIHSTFLSRHRFEGLLPDIKTAIGHGARVDILWGQSSRDGEAVSSLAEAQAIADIIRDTGLGGSLQVHLFSTRSHAKLLIADDGAGNASATVGSCNWLYSGFDSYEVSVRLRDPRLVADVLFEAAELARPTDGQLPEISIRLMQNAREMVGKASISGTSKVRLLIGSEHDDCVLEARDFAQSRVTVLSHRLGVTAKPSIIIPMAVASQQRNVNINLYYGRASGPVSQNSANSASWTYREQNVTLQAIQRPRIHAKVLMWDDDNLVVSSLNWLSADTPPDNPRQEMGIKIEGGRIAAQMEESFALKRAFDL